MNRTLLAVVFAAAGPLLLQAQTTTDPSCAQLAEQAFEVSGVNDMIAALPVQMLTQMETQLDTTKIGTADKKELMSYVQSSFLPERFSQVLRQRFLKTCDPAMLQQVVDTLNTPFGAKMRALEAYSESVEGTRKAAEYSEGFAEHQPEQARLQLVQRLDNSVGATSFAVDATIATVRGMAASLGGQPVSAAWESSLRKQITDPLHNCTLVTLLFTYRDLSDQELSRYIGLYETPAISQFNKRSKKALLDAIHQQSAEVGVSVKRSRPSSVQSGGSVFK